MSIGAAIVIAFAEANLRLRIAVETSQSNIACQLVRAGAGIAILDGLGLLSARTNDLVTRPFAPSLQSVARLLKGTKRPASCLVEEFASVVRDLLQQLGTNNVEIRVGDGSRGWREHAPSYEAYRVKGGAQRRDRLQTMSGSASRATAEQVHITSYPVGSPGACTHLPHARASLRGEEDRTHLYDGIKAPGTTGPYPSRFVAGDGGRLSRRTQGYALITAPSGMSPCVTYRHRAIISLRARATIIVRRMRPVLVPTRS